MLAGSVLSAVSCLLLPLLSESLSYSDRCGGWMWPVDLFAAAEPLTGVGNTPRCLHLRKFLRVFLLCPAPLVPCVRIIAGVGMTDSHATPDGDHRNCVSLSQAFPPFLLPSGSTGNGVALDERSA